MQKRRKNILVFLGVAALIGLAFLTRSILFHGESVYAQITVGGDDFGSYPLDQDTEIHVEIPGGGYNIVKIQNGMVWVEEADCPGQDCVHQGKVSGNGQSIICLPHQMIIRITGKQEPEYDAIAQ